MNDVGVPVFDVKPVKGQLTLVAVEGRAPTAPDEAAIGPATAKQLGMSVGDRITMKGRRSRRLTIVGETLFPSEVHSGFTEGLWVSPETMAEVGPRNTIETDEVIEEVAAIPLAGRRGLARRRAGPAAEGRVGRPCGRSG